MQGSPVTGITQRDGRVSGVVTEHGASFKGELSDDGLVIEGVIQFDGARTTALLQRVEHRKMRRAAGRRAYAT